MNINDMLKNARPYIMILLPHYHVHVHEQLTHDYI